MTLKKYLNIGLIGTAILTVLIVIVSFIFANSFATLKTTLLEKGQIEKLETSLASENNYLSSQIRLHVLTEQEQFKEKYETALAENLFAKVEQQLAQMDVPENITTQLSTIQEKSDVLAQTEIRAAELDAAGKTDEATALLFTNEYEQATKEIDTLFLTFEKDLEAWSLARANDASQTALTSMIILGICIAFYLAFILFTLWMLRTKMTPLFAMTTHAQKIADGDLTVEPLPVNEKQKDEVSVLSQAFNLMSMSLRNVLSTVSKTSNEVAAASEELLANAEQTNQTSEKVALSIENISQQSNLQQSNIVRSGQSLAEVTASIQEVAAAADGVAEISTDANKHAESGQVDVQNTMRQMQEIEGAVDDMLQSIQSLTEHSANIETFVSAITDISEQTNLLALNAAIEAARAGEGGKGFAVVADEVRQLAEQSNESASKITTIIAALQKEMQDTTAQMQNVTTKVKNGVKTVNLTGQTFNKIHHSTQSVSEKIQNVAFIAQQMFQNTSDINAASETLEMTATESATQAKDSVSLVEEQYAAMEEITAAANMLTTLAMNLNEEISRFKV